MTISILSQHGLPGMLPPLNTDIDLPLYNHLLFFGVVWVITTLWPALTRKA